MWDSTFHKYIDEMQGIAALQNAPGLRPMTGEDRVEREVTVINYKDSCVSFFACGVRYELKLTAIWKLSRTRETFLLIGLQ